MTLFSHPLAHPLVASDTTRQVSLDLTLADVKRLHAAVLATQATLPHEPQQRQELLALAAYLDVCLEKFS